MKKGLKSGVYALLALCPGVFAQLGFMQVPDLNALTRPPKAKHYDAKCPPKMYDPYHWYLSTATAGGYLELPNFKYGLRTGASGSKRFDDSPIVFDFAPSIALGYRTDDNPILPGIFGELVHYELGYRYVNGRDHVTIHPSEMEVFPITGGTSSTVSFSTPLRLDTQGIWNQLHLMLKSRWGGFRPQAGLEWKYIQAKYDVDQVNDGSGNPFSLHEDTKTHLVGPVLGMQYYHNFNKHWTFSLTGIGSAYYYDIDLDGLQQLAGSTFKTTKSENGLSFGLGVKTALKYYFSRGAIKLFGSVFDNPAYPTVLNGNQRNRSVEIDTDNENVAFFGLELTLHAPTQMKPRVGKCMPELNISRIQ